jgi:hypothetical protein
MITIPTTMINISNRLEMDTRAKDHFNNLIYESEISIDIIQHYINQIISSQKFYIIGTKKYFSCVWFNTPLADYNSLYPIVKCLSNTMTVEYLPDIGSSTGVMSCAWLVGTLIEPVYIKQPKILDTIVVIPEVISIIQRNIHHTPTEYNEI